MEEQEDELLALHSIFGPDEFVREESKCAGEIRVSVELPAGFTVALKEGETLRQYEISFLPPLHLTFDLPEDYPSSSPPLFSLTCSWLTHTQLSALGAQLTGLYQATGGAVVLFTWAQFLKEDALRFLDIHAVLELPSDEQSKQYYNQDSFSAALPEPNNGQHTPESVSDVRELSAPSLENPSTSESRGAATPLDSCKAQQNTSASHNSKVSQKGLNSGPSLPIHPRESPQNEVQTLSGLCLTPSQALLSQLLIYDAAQNQKAFSTTVFDCGVCFMGWLGAQCVQLPECGHIFCQPCLARLCKLQITEGNVRGVTCPEADCPAAPTPAQVKSLVGEELFSRYDHLLLQNTLDCMPDVTYCPRRSCGAGVIQEKSGNAAMCSVCGFAFCVTCKKTYHGRDDCQGRKTADRQTEKDAEHGVANLPQSQEGMQALWDDYTSGSKQRKHLLESRYGNKTLRLTVEHYLSDDWLASNSKNCPHCFSRIQKDNGCNVMTCSRCRRPFCWVCLARLPVLGTGGHFENGPCGLYQQHLT